MARRYKRKTGVGYIAFIVLCICFVFFIGKRNLEQKKKEHLLKEEELTTLIKKEEERELELNNLEAYVQTKKYVEDIARGKLGLVYEDEIIFETEDE